MSKKASTFRQSAVARALLAAGAVLCAGVAAAQQASAQQPAPASPRQRTPWWQQPKNVAELRLTAEQVAAIEAMDQEQRERRAAATRAYSQAYAALVVALTAETLDEPTVGRARTAVSAAWNELGAANLARIEALRTILSVAQIKRLPEVAPQALRAGPAVLRALGEVGLSSEGRSRDNPSAPK
jgi:Spy/CpxP family protein refolding chaperone